MIKSESLPALDRALGKARLKAAKVKPEIRIIEFGCYEVARSKGGYYTVRVGQTEDKEFFIACECRGSLEGLPCYHGSTAFDIHAAYAKLLSTPKAHDISIPSEGLVEHEVLIVVWLAAIIKIFFSGGEFL